MTRTARLVAFVKLGRPKFLLGGFLFYGLGAALAVITGTALDWRVYAWGQAVIIAAQLMTNYSNDYFDLAADLANVTPTHWSGGSRILPNGEIPPWVALVTALVLAACAAIATFVLAATVPNRPLIWPIASLIIVLAWCYSAPPVRLLTRGLGELATALVVTLLTPLLGFYLQRGSVGWLVLAACLPLCGLQIAMLITLELPDAAGDAALGKRTLVVRNGSEWGARACAALIATSFLVLPVLVWDGLPWLIAALAALSAPLGAWHCVRLVRGAFRDRQRFESLAFAGVALLFVTAVGELAGALILGRLS